mmetsp:Transcript_36435/g.75831  ORF Transcript_36435/g.75831 Transcript_36435/m.75831 type:complete len:207 (+) Transcript_36435:470-1090(+)
MMGIQNRHAKVVHITAHLHGIFFHTQIRKGLFHGGIQGSVLFPKIIILIFLIQFLQSVVDGQELRQCRGNGTLFVGRCQHTTSASHVFHFRHLASISCFGVIIRLVTGTRQGPTLVFEGGFQAGNFFLQGGQFRIFLRFFFGFFSSGGHHGFFQGFSFFFGTHPQGGRPSHVLLLVSSGRQDRKGLRQWHILGCPQETRDENENAR